MSGDSVDETQVKTLSHDEVSAKCTEYMTNLRMIARNPTVLHAELKPFKTRILAIRKVLVRRALNAMANKHRVTSRAEVNGDLLSPTSSGFKRRRGRPAKRDASPSLFGDEDCARLAARKKPFRKEVPHCRKVDQVLSAVEEYFPAPSASGGDPELSNGNSADSSNIPAFESKTPKPHLMRLLAPLKRTDLFEIWTPYEIAVFESGICSIGKDFFNIAKLLKTKTTEQVVAFYYKVWKKSLHYQIWKHSVKDEAGSQHIDQILELRSKLGDFF